MRAHPVAYFSPNISFYRGSGGFGRGAGGDPPPPRSQVCTCLLLFTLLQQGPAFQKRHPFGYLFGVVFEPKVRQKGYLNGASKVAPKTGRFCVHFGSMFERFGLCSRSYMGRFLASKRHRYFRLTQRNVPRNTSPSGRGRRLQRQHLKRLALGLGVLRTRDFSNLI